MKNNFTQALKELTGFDGEPNPINNTAAKTEGEVMPKFEFEQTVSDDVVSYKEFTDTQSEESTRITSSMVIKGNIKSKDNIFVHGEVIGDITTSASINSTNLIVGNVSCQDMFMNGARLRGNVTLAGDFAIGENSVVVGDIKCENINIAGKVKGNCDVAKSARMVRGAYLSGDIITDDIATEQGSRINGKISLKTANNDIDDDFDFGGEF